MMLSANVGEMDSSSTISALKAITTDPDMLTEESSNKALKILDMSSGGDLEPEAAQSGMESLSNLVCSLKLNEMGSDKNVSDFKES